MFMKKLKQLYQHTQIFDFIKKINNNINQMIENIALKVMFSAPKPMYTKTDY